LKKIKKRITSFKNQYSIIPLFHYSIHEVELIRLIKDPVFLISYRIYYTLLKELPNET